MDAASIVVANVSPATKKKKNSEMDTDCVYIKNLTLYRRKI